MEGLREWAKTLVATYGAIGLFGIAFLESSFFPLPPDFLLVALVLKEDGAMWYAAVCTLGSVTGAVGGYAVGYWGGRPLLRHLFDPEKVGRVESLYERYGVWAVLIAAFTPIPYKIFTIASGVFRLNLIGFIVVSLIGRGMRFGLVALMTALLGEAVMGWLRRMDVTSLWVVVLLIFSGAFFWFLRRLVRKG